jgi:hypothetical protein
MLDAFLEEISNVEIVELEIRRGEIIFEKVNNKINELNRKKT